MLLRNILCWFSQGFTLIFCRTIVMLRRKSLKFFSIEVSHRPYKLPDYDLIIREQRLPEIARLLKQELEDSRGDLEFSILSLVSRRCLVQIFAGSTIFGPTSLHLLMVLAGI